MKRVVAGGLLIFLGLFMLLGVFASTKSSSLTVMAGVMLLFVVTPVVLGSTLIRSHFKAKNEVLEGQKRSLMAAREKEVIKLAQRSKGELTIPEIVADTSMTSDEAEEVMKELVVKRYVDMKMTDKGVIVYEFFEILQKQENADRRSDTDPVLE